MKTSESIRSTLDIHRSSSDKCGLIANDGNDMENADGCRSPNDGEPICCDSSDDNELETVPSQNSRGLRKTVLNNVDRFLNSANKQIKL